MASGRISKTIQMVIGIAVSSGTFLVFQGTAVAAAEVMPADGRAVAAQNEATDETPKAPEQTEEGVMNSQPTTELKNAVPETTGAVSPGAPTDGGEGVTADMNGKSHEEAASALAQPADVASEVTFGTKAIQDEASANIVAGEETGMTKEIAAEVTATADPMVVDTGETSHTLVEAAAPTTVSYGAQVLPIQPVIKNHTMIMVTDLAAGVPSAAAPVRDPEPLEPVGGLWGGLTLMLSGVAMPHWQAWLPDDTAMAERALVLVLVVLVLVSLVVASYGMWLRRSGFMYAARSDAAAMKGMYGGESYGSTLWSVT